MLLETEHPAKEDIGDVTGLTREQGVLASSVIVEGNFTVITEDAGTL